MGLTGKKRTKKCPDWNLLGHHRKFLWPQYRTTVGEKEGEVSEELSI